MFLFFVASFSSVDFIPGSALQLKLSAPCCITGILAHDPQTRALPRLDDRRDTIITLFMLNFSGTFLI